MEFNASKSAVMVVCPEGVVAPAGPSNQISIGGVPVERVSVYTYLGVAFNDALCLEENRGTPGRSTPFSVPKACMHCSCHARLDQGVLRVASFVFCIAVPLACCRILNWGTFRVKFDPVHRPEECDDVIIGIVYGQRKWM